MKTRAKLTLLLLLVLAGAGTTQTFSSSLPLQGRLVKQIGGNVNGVRRGYAHHEPMIPNSDYRPEVRGVPFGAQYPRALRDILVQNGILNSDYTPNEATAEALGWKLLDRDRRDSEHPGPRTRPDRGRVLVARWTDAASPDESHPSGPDSGRGDEPLPPLGFASPTTMWPT